MIFHSVQFVAFFVAVYLLYIQLGHKAQNRMLLVASYVFYGWWDWRFLSLIALTTVTDFLCVRGIHRSDVKAVRQRFVAVSVVVNLGVLGFFKYFDFFLENLSALVAVFGVQLTGPGLNILLPVGISFYTFQSMSYTLDVYRKQVEPTDDFLDYALYVSFFPQLVAGPIERARNLLPQITSPRVHTPTQMRQGVLLIFFGFFKKLFIADNLATIVDPVFAPGADPSGAQVLIGGYAFIYQVYCDFSGYTDIARGTSKLLGVELMENFRTPYLSTNLQDYWNRWHISLTTWIRDYLYYPLAFLRIGNRSLPASVVTVVTFVIMGLWHGAAWGFVLWGAYHGLCLALYGNFLRRFKRKKQSWAPGWVPRPAVVVAKIIGMYHVILVGELFFRSGTFTHSMTIFRALLTDFSLSAGFFADLGGVALFILPMLLLDILTLDKPLEEKAFGWPRVVRYAAYYAMFTAIVKFGTTSDAFFYFQF